MGLTAIPRGAIADLIGGLSGFKCYWNGDAMDFDSTYVQLDILAYAGVDTDEQRRGYDPATDQIGVTSCGIRTFTLVVQVRSYDMSEPGYEICERIRRRLRAGAAQAILEQEGLALTMFKGPIVDLNMVADNRPIYASNMDIGFAFAVNETDIEPSGGGDYIADAPTTGTVTGGALPPATPLYHPTTK